jgi:hypothetical protein
MKSFTNEEKQSIYRIFNHIDNLCGNYHGQKTFVEAQKFASLNRWLMYSHKTILSLRDGVKAPYPNIFISPESEDRENEILGNDHGCIEGSIGVTYGNTDSFERFLEIKRKKPVKLIESINELSAGWEVWISQKIKTEFPENTPVYRGIKGFSGSSVTIPDIEKAISDSNNDLLKKGEFYKDEEVLWCVTIISIERETYYTQFDKDIKEAFSLFEKLLKLKPLRNEMAERHYKKLKMKPKKKNLTGVHKLKALESRL